MLGMKRYLIIVTLLSAAFMALSAQTADDPRCLNFMGMPLEGPADSMDTRLKAMKFVDWGVSDDGTERHYRGDYYGIRGKLMVSVDPKTQLVSSAYVTIGPYSTPEFLDRNFRYFRVKLENEFGELTTRDGAMYHIGDFGLIKLSVVKNENGSRDIKVFYYPTAPYYKDALALGQSGNVMEVVTDNPVLENPVEHFDRLGRSEQQDIVDREYNAYGYLVKAKMNELSGNVSTLEYKYDRLGRLQRRTLLNTASGLSSVNEYTYDDDDSVAPAQQSQRVFDGNGSCLLSILMKNNYTEFDDNDNWTTNKVELTYWEKEGKTRRGELVQKRTISYWE